MRNAEQTRTRLLEAAFKEILEHGYQAASLERILSNTQVTKGALYYHFPNKQALGLAVVDDVIAPSFRQYLIEPLNEADDPLPVLSRVLTDRILSCGGQQMQLGCPVNNLIQEMSPLDEDFRTRLCSILDDWRSAIEAALVRGQRNGHVRADVDAVEAAAFLAAAVEGIQGIGKVTLCVKSMQGCLHQLQTYLQGLAA